MRMFYLLVLTVTRQNNSEFYQETLTRGATTLNNFPSTMWEKECWSNVKQLAFAKGNQIGRKICGHPVRRNRAGSFTVLWEWNDISVSIFAFFWMSIFRTLCRVMRFLVRADSQTTSSFSCSSFPISVV